MPATFIRSARALTTNLMRMLSHPGGTTALHLILLTVGSTFPLLISLYSQVRQGQDFMESTQWVNSGRNDQPEIFDFIIVGGGSAGAVLANRLSKSPNNNVLLLELNGDPNPISRIPVIAPILHRCPGVDLSYETLPQNNSAKALRNRVLYWPRGTGLGGSSNLNAMIYQRGNPQDYDNWANLTGDSTWSFEALLPYFKKLEDYHGEFPNDKYHGTGGPMHIEKVRQSYMDDYFLKAAKEKGYPVMDLNGKQTQGFSHLEVTMKDGLRWSTYSGYIEPILTRTNLKIYRYSRVIKVHLDKNRHAYGLTYIRHGIQRFVRARREIILSAGAIDTPKLLMLSGIGPKPHLHSVGLKCRVNLPVGRNLQDHVFTMLGPFLVDTDESFLINSKPMFNTLSILQQMGERKGPIFSTTVSAIGYISSSLRNDSTWPDIQYSLVGAGLMPGYESEFERIANVRSELLQEYWRTPPEGQHANFFITALARPKSRGFIELSGSDPYLNPRIQPNYFSHKDDIKILVEGARKLVEILEETSVYKAINARLLPHVLPGCEQMTFKSDDFFECFIRHFTMTVFHPVRTAAMGQSWRNFDAVVDSELKVFKVAGLRVTDASIMPEIVNSNTNIPVIMIGEKGSDLIRGHWAGQFSVTPRTGRTYYYPVFHEEEDQCYYSRLP